MKRIIKFSKFFLPAFIIAVILTGACIAGFFLLGFNLGIDFQGGLMQEVQFAPPAFKIGYTGRGNATILMSRSNLTIVISGSGIEESQHDFPFSVYGTVDVLLDGLNSIEGVETDLVSDPSIQSSWLLLSAQSDPLLSSNPLFIHFLAPNADIILIEDVRASLEPLGNVSVQVLGDPLDRHFMIRLSAGDVEDGDGIPAEVIISKLEEDFGFGGVAVSRSDFVGSSVSRQLTDQVGMLIALTMLLILIYSTIRFKPQYAIGAVLGIVYNGLITTGFIIWTRMEFNTISIAAILTILGYSINDTIVVFDRQRENRRLYPDDKYVKVLNRSLSETLGRTIITTFTTMLAVASLYIFTSGSMKDFALTLIVGMITGVFASIFLASGFVYFWETYITEPNMKKAQTTAVSKSTEKT